MLYEQINNEIKDAMRNKDAIKRDCLRMVMDKAKTIYKDKNPNDSSGNISDDIMLDAIKKEYKQQGQTATSLVGREDTDLYKETVVKMEILNCYLPKQMTYDEIKNVVNEILSKNDTGNFGQNMRLVMSELKGKADNKMIKEAVEAYNN